VALQIREADLADPRDAARLVEVLDSYASDPVGGSQPLSPGVRERLVPALREQPNALVLLALDGERGVGIAICFYGLSTFVARPLLNIHDVAVVPDRRGRGVGSTLLAAVEARARERGCCKLTLEVQDSNVRARNVYERFGFVDFTIGATGPTRFLSKPIDGPAEAGTAAELRGSRRGPADEAHPDRDRATLVVREADYSAESERLTAIRFAVFVDEQRVPAEIELDDRDPHCIHVLALTDDRDVGTARIDLGHDGKIGRLAVLAAARRRGIGSALMRALHAIARRHGLGAVWCHAQLAAVPFYETLAYRPVGEPFEEAGIEHVRMERNL
jgi:GNAT superfamily N-acetyltransferase